MYVCVCVYAPEFQRLKFRSKIIMMPASALIKMHKKLILSHGNCSHISMCILLKHFFVGSNFKQSNIGGSGAVQSRVKKVIDTTANGVGKRKEMAWERSGEIRHGIGGETIKKKKE